MKIVFIESPNKRESIKKYLGSEYLVFATKGHIRDLPAKSFAIDLKNNYTPSFEIMPTKKNMVAEMRKTAQNADAIYLATDPDREGEAIAWHIANILGLDENAQVRTSFNEISKKAVLNSIANPKALNYNLINAQIGRRVLDRIVGYKLSPLISKKIQNSQSLSAGRVQSVTLKLIVDREKAINSFVPVEYWNINAVLKKQDKEFKSELIQYKDKKIEIGNKDEADKVLSDLENAEFKVEAVKRQVTYSKPPAPYTTSTLQQDAIKKLKMTASSYTKCAQSLYEGIMIEGEGKTALVTYIRTDSTRVSTDAQFMAKEYILENFGKEYAPSKFNEFSTKEHTQDAHEAIRPINLKFTPESLKGKVEEQYLKLYTLIFKRFVASQMNYAKYDSLTVDIVANDYKFRSSGKALLFEGYLRMQKELDDDKNGINIPDLLEGEIVKKEKILSEQKFTKPPVRFAEDTITKEMEAQGIGRPSTYANTITTLLNREYIKKNEKRQLVPTELGTQVTEYLEEYFKDIMNVKFTAEMESKLDDVEEAKLKWQDIVDEFYKGFEKELKNASVQSGISLPKPAPEPSDIKCEKCGAMMVYREGKFGRFLACSNFPQCKNTKNVPKENDVTDTGICPKCGGVVSAKHSKKGKLFFGCDNYPNCDFISWDLPLTEKCPKCNSGLYLRVNARGKRTILCINKGCDYVKEN